MTRRRGGRDVHLAWAVASLLAAVVGGRLVAVWFGTSPSPARVVVSLAIVAVFVGIPAAYGLQGLLRHDDAPGGDDTG